MKKGIIVLLITVLVAGFAFASFSGNAAIKFSVDLDKKAWGFVNSTSVDYKFDFAYDSADVAIDAHETKIWAEIAAEASAKLAITAKGASPANAAFTPSGSAKITKADIHIGEALTIGILSAGSAADFAKTYYKVGDNVASYVKEVGTAPGFTVSYKVAEDSVWAGGFGAKGSWATDPATYNIFAHVETPTFKFDALSVNAGAYAYLTDKASVAPTNFTNFGGGAKVAYDADKFDADAELDLQYIAIENNEKFVFEAAANATLNFVEGLPITINVYATPGILADTTNYNATAETDEAIKLDAKVGTGYTFKFDEKLSLAVKGSVEIRDALIDKRELTIGADETGTYTIDDKTSVELYFAETWKVLQAKTLELEAKATYKAAKFTAYGDVKTGFLFDDSDATKLVGEVLFECGISSTAVVENATLALVYGDNSKKTSYLNFLDVENHMGAVTASATIAFK